MSVRKKVFLLLILCSALTSAQNIDVYIVFKPGYMDSCSASAYRDGRNKIKTTFEYRYTYGFLICGETFVPKVNTCISEVVTYDLKSLNIITIDDFKRKRESTMQTQLADPNKLYPKIYILQMMANHKYLKFEVLWVEEFYHKM